MNEFDPILSRADIDDIERRFSLSVINNRFIIGERAHKAVGEILLEQVYQDIFRLKVNYAVSLLKTGNGDIEQFSWHQIESISNVIEAYSLVGRDWLSVVRRVMRSKVMVVPREMVNRLLDPESNHLAGIADGCLLRLEPVHLSQPQLAEFLVEHVYNVHAAFEGLEWLPSASAKLGELAFDGNTEAGYAVRLGYATSHGVPVGPGDFVLVHDTRGPDGEQVSRITLHAVVGGLPYQRSSLLPNNR